MWMELKGLLLKTKKYNSAKRKRGKICAVKGAPRNNIVEECCAHFCFVMIGGNLTAQLTGSHRGIAGGIQIPET